MAGALAVLLLFLVLPAGAAAQLPTLTGQTQVVADRSGSALVDVPQAIRFPNGDAKAWPALPEFSPGEDLVVVTFLALGRQVDAFNGRRSITYKRVGSASGYVALGSSLPPGRYRMYVATLAPVRVTLRFPGLGGTSQLAVTDAEPIQIAALPESPVPSPASSAFGQDGTLPEDGDMFIAGWTLERGEATADRYGVCAFRGGGPPTGAAAYEPGCPGGMETSLVYLQDADAHGVLASYIGFPSGTWGLGYNVAHAGSRPEARAWAAWMPYRAAEIDRVPAAPAPPPPAARPAARGTLTVTARRVRNRRGRVRLPLACSAEGPCEATVAAGRRRANVRLPAGGKRTIALRVRRRARRVTLVISERTDTGVAMRRHPLRLSR